MVQTKPNPKEYGPKLNIDGKIKVIVSGPASVRSDDPGVVIVRKG
ncbi:MAG: hypothetical protein Q7J06_05090 [Bacteroidales bacterium]|nr:hypothetical protein [Bacteroidales bacterium]